MMGERSRLVVKLGERGAEITALHFRPEMARAIQVVLEEAPPTRDGNVVLTSGSEGEPGDGIHSDTSLHYEEHGASAVDFRGWNLRGEGGHQLTVASRRAEGAFWAARVQARLGGDYDVLWEESDADPRFDHLHVEYEPRPGRPLPAGFYARIGQTAPVAGGQVP